MFDHGIMHVVINHIEEDEKKQSERFRISDFEGVQWHALKHDKKAMVTTNDDYMKIQTQDGYDTISYKLQFKPFRIEMFINETSLMEVNSNNLLYFEKKHIKPDIDYENDAFHEFYKFLPPDYRNRLYNNKINAMGPSFDFRESIGLSFKLHSQYLYGLPERAERLLLKTTEDSQPYRMYNMDVFQHQSYNPQSLYGSIPYLTAHSDKFDTAIVWMNSAETFVDIFNVHDYQSITPIEQLEKNKKLQFKQKNAIWLSESGVMEFFIFSSSNSQGSGPMNIMKKLSTITGFLPLPPYFSFGFHYSKWEHISTGQLSGLIDNFNEYDMPLDVLWLDIEYATGKRYFAFDKERFKDLPQFLDKIEKEQKRLTIITDPHIKIDDKYFVYTEGSMVEMTKDIDGRPVRGAFIRSQSGLNEFVGQCWPNASVWVDFLNTNAMKWWADLYQYDKFKGTSKLFSYWIDMNEPSVFSGDELTLPKNALHITTDGKSYFHKDVHNAYGILMAKATYQGIINREPSKNLRPFMLSRSVFFGSQKYGAMWTGDNQASIHFLGLSIQMCLSLGISGLPICGADIGGFTGYASQKLISKWYQHAVFQPFFRAHAHESVKFREPWHQGDQLYIIKEYVHLRHSLMPYIYTQTYFTTQSGVPLMRPMWMQYPEDFITFGIDTNYMFGESFLIAATYPNLEKVKVYLPPIDDWYDFYTSEIMTPSAEIRSIKMQQEEIGVYIKGGSIIPRKYMRRLSALQTLHDNYLLDIYPTLNNGNYQAKGMLYLDDGETFEHLTNKEYSIIEFIYDNGRLSINLIAENYRSGQSFTIDEVNIFGMSKIPHDIVEMRTNTMIKDNGKGIKSKYSKEESHLEISNINIHMINHASNESPVLTVKFHGDGSYIKTEF